MIGLFIGIFIVAMVCAAMLYREFCKFDVEQTAIYVRTMIDNAIVLDDIFKCRAMVNELEDRAIGKKQRELVELFYKLLDLKEFSLRSKKLIDDYKTSQKKDQERPEGRVQEEGASI